MRFEPLRFPKLKFFAQSHEGDVSGDAGVFAQAFRKNGASVLIDGQNLARAEESCRELVLLVGIRREVLDERVDLVDEALSAGVERGRIERGIAVDAVEAVFGENRAERSRKLGARISPAASGRWREPRGGGTLRLVKNRLAIRSSSE